MGAINFGYSIGVFNSMQQDFKRVFDLKTQDEQDTWVSII